MRTLFPAFVLAVLVIPAPASAQLTLTMDGGMVTLVAKDVPLSTIMAEWAKVGKTSILNGDKIFTPVTLQLENVPEKQALDILLRGAAGYMLAERATAVAEAPPSTGS
jgi:type II secretory pathway component HofQ